MASSFHFFPFLVSCFSGLSEQRLKLVCLDFLLRQTFKRNTKVNKECRIPAGTNFPDESTNFGGQSLKAFFHQPPSFPIISFTTINERKRKTLF